MGSLSRFWAIRKLRNRDKGDFPTFGL